MNKILHAIFLLTICCSILITSGCASDTRSNSSSVSGPDTGSDIPSVSEPEPDEGFELVPISEIRENFSQSVEEVRASEFVNLNFSKAEFSFPETDSISRLSLSPQTGISPRELYDFYCERIEYLLPGVYSDEEKLNLMRFCYRNNDDLYRLTIDEYEPLYDGGDTPAVLFEDKKCFMQGIMSSVEWFFNDDLSKWRGIERLFMLPDLGDELNYGTKAADYVTDLNSEDKYELINGEMSIKDAAGFVNNFLETTVFSPYEQDAKTKLLAVDVVDIGEGKYGYGFITGYEYKNVLFDYPEMGGVGRGHGVSNDYDDENHHGSNGHISMIQTDKVFHFIVPVLGESIEEVETYTSAVTLQDAVNIISEFYSEYMNFTVTRVEVVYMDRKIPCWKFVMRCSGNVYNTFVDMQTGEVHLYIQAGG